MNNQCIKKVRRMKIEKNVFRCFNPVLALCVMLVFAMLMSGCNDSDDNDSSTTETIETVAWYMDADGDGYSDETTQEAVS